MSLIMNIGPTGKETDDDHINKMMYQYPHGTKEEKGYAHMVLTLRAIEELDLEAENRNSRGNNENKVSEPRITTTVFNLRESVDRRLSMCDYGIAPMITHLFPVLDRFSVFGNWNGIKAGLSIDFQLDSPTKTLAFATSPNVGELAEHCLSLKNYEGKSAYTEMNQRMGEITISDFTDHAIRNYADRSIIYPHICEGILVFGGKGKTQNDIVKDLANHLDKADFTVEEYIFRQYDFPISFSPKDGSNVFQREASKLRERIYAAMSSKAA